jgi:25S rRNA (uracil2843-N3)-methyltransferase
MTQNKGGTRTRPGDYHKSKNTPKPSKPSKPSSITPSPSGSTSTPLLPLELQQLLLDIFRDSFPTLLTSGDELITLLQSIKGALFARDFERAFGRREWLEAYAVRWSAGRALAYAEALGRWWGVLTGRLGGEEGKKEKGRNDRRPVRVVCFGGGAAEVVALGGLVRYRCLESNSEVSTAASPKNTPLLPADKEGAIADMVKPPLPDTAPMPTSPSQYMPTLTATTELDIQLIDSASWCPIISILTKGLTTTPPPPKYASASAKTATPLLPNGALTTSFLQADLLAMSRSQLESAISVPRPSGSDMAPAVVVMTLLFTLNELYTTSVAKTTRFLLDITAIAGRGSTLLVVDSPGSYSEAGVGKANREGEGEEKKEADGGGSSGKRKYPMQWLLDHTLLGSGTEDEPLWEKVLGEESRWFRLNEQLRYPISLENMRYQVHIYRRI